MTLEYTRRDKHFTPSEQDMKISLLSKFIQWLLLKKRLTKTQMRFWWTLPPKKKRARINIGKEKNGYIFSICFIFINEFFKMMKNFNQPFMMKKHKKPSHSKKRKVKTRQQNWWVRLLFLVTTVVMSHMKNGNIVLTTFSTHVIRLKWIFDFGYKWGYRKCNLRYG